MNVSTTAPKEYARAKLLVSLSSGATNLIVLAAFLFSGASLGLARWLGSPSASAGSSWMLVALYVLIVAAGFFVLDLPFGWWGRSLEIRFGMNRQSAASWWRDEGKGAALGLGLGVLAAEIVYALLRSAPANWWWWAWGVFTLFTVLMAQLGPVLLLPLFFTLRRMSEDNDREGLLVRRLESTYAALRAQDPRLPQLHGIFEWKLGEKSAKANAALTGIGKTRRVIISDTLLESSSVEEIEAVFIHELGHHVHRDIWRGIGFQAALSWLGFWLAHLILRAMTAPLGLRGIADVAGLPLLILVFTLLGLLLMPASNGFVRAMERRADDYSFVVLGTAQPLIAGLRRLAEKNLAEVDPPRWKEWLLYSHPSIANRIRRGQAWESSHQSALGLR